MKLLIGCPIWNPLKHEYYRFLIPMFLRLKGNVPPPLPRNEKVGSQVNVTFWFWMMYPPPQERKSWISGQWDILVLDDVPPPQEWKSWISGQCDILVLDDEPPQQWKSWILGQHDILVLDDVPPPQLIEINMNAIENNWDQQVLFTYLPSPPPPQYNLILCLNRKLVNFNVNWIWIHGFKPHLPPLSSPKYEMFIFGLPSTSDDRLRDPSKKHWPKCKKTKKTP